MVQLAGTAPRLPEQFHDRLACGQGAREAGGVLRIADGNVEGVVNSRGQSFGPHGVGDGILAELVRLAVYALLGDARFRRKVATRSLSWRRFRQQ